MTDSTSLTVSVVALVISATTAWLTLFRRGTVRMTRPTVIYFGPDKGRPGGRPAPPKVFLQAMLFSTAQRGRIVESMHATVARSETRQNFSVWVHGATNGELVRGRGLFVGQSGVATDHHFLTPNDGEGFKFSAGQYLLTVYAQLLDKSRPLSMFSQLLEVPDEIARQLEQPGTGLYFDWGPDSQRYLPHVEQKSPVQVPVELVEMLKQMGST